MRSPYYQIRSSSIATLIGLLILSSVAAGTAGAGQPPPPPGWDSDHGHSSIVTSLTPHSPPGDALRPGLSTPAQGYTSEAHFPALYIVFEWPADGMIRPTMYREVQLGAPLLTISEDQLAAHLLEPERNAQRLVLDLASESTGVFYRNTVDVPRWLRGEFHGQVLSQEGAPIEGWLIPLDVRTFVVRLPMPAGQGPEPAHNELRLDMRDSDLQLLASFDVGQLMTNTPQIRLDVQATDLTPGLLGDPGNRVDLLVMGDGYTAGEQSQFLADATSAIDSFFDISPYQEYANYVNTEVLFTASPQSGADHPLYQAGCQTPSCCADPEMLSDPLQGTFVDTAFDARYCVYNIHRLLSVNYSKVFATASAAPDWDSILVLVNDTTYGGSGGTLGVISMHPYAVQIAQHEYGHSFADLADEYDDPYPAFPPCSDLSGYAPCEANVTDVATRDVIKWNPWIDAETPIPTVPEFDPAWADVVGLFEGARYLSSGMYRPGQNCIMRSLGAPYCQVPSQAYVLKLYQGGWGNPASGIRLIEPGSTFPASDSITMAYPATQLFSASLLQPVGGPPVDIEWQVDGVPVPGETTSSFTYAPAPSDLGDVQIRLVVDDPTSLVHPAMSGGWLQTSHTWTVTVEESSQLFLPLILHDE
jgi:hypothetical protein